MSEEETKNTDDAPKKGKWVKRILILVVVLIVLGGGLVALGPAIATSGPAQGIIKSQVNAKVPGEVDWQTLSLGWTNRLLLEEVTYKDSERPLTIHIDSIESDGTLVEFLSNGGAFNVIPINHIEVDVLLPAQGAEEEAADPKKIASEAMDSVNDLIKQAAGLWNTGLGLKEKVTIKKITVRILREKGGPVETHEVTPETETTQVQPTQNQDEISASIRLLPGGTLLKDGLQESYTLTAHNISLTRDTDNGMIAEVETFTLLYDFRKADGRIERFATELGMIGEIQGKA